VSRKSVLSRHANSLVEPELPLRTYFLSVGGALLLLLLAADPGLPTPLPSPLTDSHSALPPIRIHTELKGPEAVIIDTSRFGVLPMPLNTISLWLHRSCWNLRSPTPLWVSVTVAQRQRLICAFAKAWRGCSPPFTIKQAEPQDHVASRHDSASSHRHGPKSCGDLLSIRASIPASAAAFH
jgi:hypothetical protein